MTVGELMKELRKLPKDAEIFQVKDWDEQDEDGHFLDLYRLDYVIEDTIYIDTGFDFEEEKHIILDFERSKAKPKINRDMP